jgi:hypothetical protein
VIPIRPDSPQAQIGLYAVIGLLRPSIMIRQ